MATPARRTVLGASAALGTAALAACGSSGSRGDIPEELSTDISAQIAYSIWDQAHEPTTQRIIEAFREEYPQVEVAVSVTPFTQYFEKLRTQASGGDLPDVFWMNGPNVQLYAIEGLLQDVSEVPGFDPANYPEAMNELYTVEGAQYGIPKDFDTIGLWWNADVFERAGVEPPAEGWTWEDYAETARAISEALGSEGIWGGSNGVENQSFLYPLVFQAGGEIISADGTTSGYDSPEAIEALTFARSLIEDGALPSIPYTTENRPADVFNSGRAGMFWSGNWSAAVFKDSPVRDAIRTAPLPTGRQSGNVIHGVANAMAAEGSEKEAAAAFLAFLGGERANLIQAEDGAANPAYVGTGEVYVEALPEFSLQMFVDAAEDALPYPVSQNTEAWLALEREYFPQILNGDIEVEAGLSELATGMNQALADER